MTPTDICNMALAFIAKGRISSMDEQTEQARQCKLFYDIVKKDSPVLIAVRAEAQHIRLTRLYAPFLLLKA